MARKVTKAQLREIWNNPEFQADLLRRTSERLDVYEALAPPEAGQEPGTISHVWEFYSHSPIPSQLLGTFHAYRRPDGSLGASGLLDPILLMIDGVPHIDP